MASTTRRLPLRASLALLAGLLATACQQAAADLPPSPRQVQLSLDEYSIQAPDRLSPGHVVFEVRNDGDRRHSLTVVRLPEDFPTTFAEHYAQGQERALGTVFVLTPRQPGSRDLFALDLAPGRYGLICTLRDEDGTLHSHKGMATQIRVPTT